MNLVEFTTTYGSNFHSAFITTDMGRDFMEMMDSLAPEVPDDKRGDANMALDFMGAQQQHRKVMTALKSIKARKDTSEPLEATFTGAIPGEENDGNAS